MLKSAPQRGVTLIEMMIALVIGAGLMTLAMPTFTLMLQNAQIRSAAEGIQTGLQLARAEAVKRNVAVRFQLTSTADGTCALSPSGRNWVISIDDPAGSCASAASDTDEPRIIQVRAAQEGGAGVTVAGFLAGTPSSGQSVAVFNGLGQITTPNNGGINFRLTNPAVDYCKDQGGDLRCLQINVSRSGQIRMCDPSRTGTDPEAC